MLFGSICFVFAIAGIIGFYNDLYILTYIGLGLCLFESVLGRLEGTLKSMNTTIIAGILGWLITKNFWLGIAIGVCFENVIMFIGGIVMMYITSKAIAKYEKNQQKEENEESTKN